MTAPQRPLIRPLDARADLDLVQRFYCDSPDYWQMAEGRAPDAAKAAAFFTDGPPGCDPARSHRLGLFENKRLSGLLELSFGFPEPTDAYLGLLLLGPWAQGRGWGVQALRHAETLARAATAPQIFVAVIEANTRAMAFWQREGFAHTGLSVDYAPGTVQHRVHRLRKPL